MPENWWTRQQQQWSGYGLSWGLRRLLKSLDIRLTHYDRSVDPALPEFSGRAIYLFWHEYITFPIALWGHYNVTMLASQHRDADWLIGAADRLGFDVVRGSTNRGGSKAIRELKRYASVGSLTITPDGPRGPRREMALGAIFLASRFGLPIVPVGFGYDRPYRFRTWDQFAIPRPLSRGRAIMGPRLSIPPKIGREELEAHRLQTQGWLQLLTETAEAWAASGGRMQGELPFRRLRPKQKPLAVEPAPAPRSLSITQNTLPSRCRQSA